MKYKSADSEISSGSLLVGDDTMWRLSTQGLIRFALASRAITVTYFFTLTIFTSPFSPITGSSINSFFCC